MKLFMILHHIPRLCLQAKADPSIAAASTQFQPYYTNVVQQSTSFQPNFPSKKNPIYPKQPHIMSSDR